jgi:hypothetical protein
MSDSVTSNATCAIDGRRMRCEGSNFKFSIDPRHTQAYRYGLLDASRERCREKCPRQADHS